MYVNSRSVSGANQPGPISPRPAVPRGKNESNGTPSAASDPTDVSAKGQLMSKLSQLEQADPKQFKGAVSSLVAELRQASARESGLGAKMMAQLAGKLDKVIEDGNREGLAAATERAAPDAPRAAETSSTRASQASSDEGSDPRSSASSSGAGVSGSPGAAGQPAPRAGSATPAGAAAAYRANAPGSGRDEEGARAALAKVLDQLDAAMKATGSG
jgi:hypothetical protein